MQSVPVNRLSQMVTRTQSVMDTIERKADLKGLELDAVRVVEDDPEEPTFRVLAVDAPDERDQVGFQITHPSGPLSTEMFNERLESYLQALKDKVRDSTDDNESDDEYDLPDPEDVEDTAETVGEDDTEEAVPTNSSVESAEGTKRIDAESSQTLGEALGTQHITVELTVSDEQFTDEIEATLSELVEPLGDDMDELETDVEEIDDRLSRIEETLGQVGPTDNG